ncbi:hypothetical protein CCMSSC00406_0004832 [Pleurotus cornucopiae]|uniref:Uncharacterized protein n=1 Tax=Pleurotus cornucopiae TaxID=5321 RepID=A0ACB7J1C0_PLECO|nr:hypothetical protein CCMSSC00406_0004832 [Pleurotus cornucopiae]
MPISSPGHIDLLKAYWLWTVLIMSVLSVPLNRFDEVQSVLESPLPDGHRPASLPVRNPTKSFWIDTPGANPLAKEGSSGDLTSDADVCIIGSGITGVSAAYHLAKAANASDDNFDLKIVILEARDFCSGATGRRNGGHLTPAAFLDFTLAQAAHGTDETIRSLALERYTVSEIVKLLEEKDVAEAVDLVAGGHTTMLFTDAELEQAKRDFEAAKNAGVDLSSVEWISRQEMETRFGASFPGFHFPSYNLWPLKLVTQLYLKASKLTSLHLHTNTPVEKITSIPTNESRASRRWSLHTGRGKVACSYVIHATNAYASHLLPHMSGPGGIVPTRGQIVAIRADAPTSKLSKASWDGNEGFEYWFPRPVSTDETPLVILGGGREAGSKFEYYETDDSSVSEVVGQALRGFLPSVFPKLYTRGKDPEMEWTGIMGYTSMRDPFVGPVLRPSGDNDEFDGQYIAAGYTGHGMPRAFACAEAVSQMVMAKVMGNEWVRPTWLPERYLTWKRYITSK